jgi:nucleoside-diphosphate-sugar epimerase
VHGQAPVAGTTESSPLSNRQSIPYNNAKVEAERRLLRLRAAGKVEVVLLRPGIVFGPRSSWISNFADALFEGKAYLIDRGQGICNSIYVDNLVHAIWLAMTAENVDCEAFLLGDGEYVTWADLYRPIATTLGIDLLTVPEATKWISSAPSWLSQVNALRQARAVRMVSRVLPGRFKRAAREAIHALADSPEVRPSSWASPASREVVTTEEIAQLYRCKIKLPFDKAIRLLGYTPPVSFEEGCRRTVDWLAFSRPYIDLIRDGR